MEHRGGVGYEKNTGDGAGILTGIPHKLLSAYAQQEFGVSLSPRQYGVGIIFLPNDSDERAMAKKIFSETLACAPFLLLAVALRLRLL